MTDIHTSHISRTGYAAQDVILPFGKHKGKQLKQVDDGYLHWVHRKFNKSWWWRKMASEALKERKQQQQQRRKRSLLDELKVTKSLQRGREIHMEALEIGRDIGMHFATALVKMYATCRSMDDAHKVFDTVKQPDVVLWTVIILGYAENGEGKFALDLFGRMTCEPDPFTFVAALKACASLGNRETCLEWGKQIHSQIGFHLDMYVLNNLIDMYAKCESMIEARKVFDSIMHPDVVSWTAIILGYAENGEGVTALRLFRRMRSQGCAPDSLAFYAALKACGLLGALECGNKIYAEINRTGPNAILVTCLVDFYAKCGDLVSAKKVFDLHPRTRDVRTWTALLAGYSGLGDTEVVFRLVELMQDAGFPPDGVTFLFVLMCCSHAGLVEKGEDCLEAMSTKYAIMPTVEHYTCLIDILGRSNKLDDATALLRSMPCRPDVVTWTTVLGACSKWKNLEIGRLAFKSSVGLDETDATAYVLMAQIYGSRGMWEEQEMVLAMRRELKQWRQPGKACWANEEGEVHTFVSTELRALGAIMKTSL